MDKCESCKKTLVKGEAVLIIEKDENIQLYCQHCYCTATIYYDNDGNKIAESCEDNVSEDNYSPYICCVCDEMHEEINKVDGKLYCDYCAMIKLGYRLDKNVWCKGTARLTTSEVINLLSNYSVENEGGENDD